MNTFMQMLKPLIQLLYNKIVLANDDQIAKTEADAEAYRQAMSENVVAMVANALSTYTLSDSTISIIGDNARAEILREVSDRHFATLKGVLADALGVGLVVSLPNTHVVGNRKKLCIDTVGKDRVFLTEVAGDDVISCTIVADVRVINSRTYIRLADYTLDKDAYIIRSRAVLDGSPAPLDVLPDWADIQPEIRISGVDRLPIAFLKCPISNRVPDNREAVPITFGCEKTIAKIAETLEQIETEFKSKETRIFANEQLFDNKNRLANVYKTIGDNPDFFELVSPDIRSSAFFDKLTHHFAMLEREIGCSAGVLTELATSSATATEIRAKMYKTFALCTDIQKAVERYYTDLMYSCDVMANVYNISPVGDYDIKFDWSYGLIEDPAATYQQIKEGVSDGVISKAEYRRYITDETLSEAEEAVAKIAEENPTLESLLGAQALQSAVNSNAQP
jgi:A118 family predicted phage portal protein